MSDASNVDGCPRAGLHPRVLPLRMARARLHCVTLTAGLFMLGACGNAADGAELNDASTLPPADDGEAGPSDAQAPDANVRGDAGVQNPDAGDRDDAATDDAGETAPPDGGPVAPTHCGPGVVVPENRFALGSGPNHADSCSNAGFAGAQAAGVIDIDARQLSMLWDIPLAIPMTANAPYAGSLELSYDGDVDAHQVEIWGTTASCAEGTRAERLYTKVLPVGRQVHCFDLQASTAYSHWILVVRDIDDARNQGATTVALYSAAFCAEGTCPRP